MVTKLLLTETMVVLLVYMYTSGVTPPVYIWNNNVDVVQSLEGGELTHETSTPDRGKLKSNITRDYIGMESKIHRGLFTPRTNITKKLFIVQKESGNPPPDRGRPILTGNDTIAPSKQSKNVPKSTTMETSHDPNYLGIRTPERLFYTRVPKCGSTTLSALIESLCANNRNFHIVKVLTDTACYRKLDHCLGPMDIMDRYLSVPKPTFGPWRHTYFLNFEEHGMEMPEYMSLIRDPLQQRMSMYYYEAATNKHFKEFENMTMNECIRKRKPLCTNKYVYDSKFNTLTYFCGYAEKCRYNSRAILSIAKRNIQQYYGVVGIVEDFSATLELLEYTYPTFFTGLAEKYAEIGQFNTYVKREKKSKPVLSQASTNFLKSQLPLDYELYSFVKQRFYQQLFAKRNATQV